MSALAPPLRRDVPTTTVSPTSMVKVVSMIALVRPRLQRGRERSIGSLSLSATRALRSSISRFIRRSSTSSFGTSLAGATPTSAFRFASWICLSSSDAWSFRSAIFRVVARNRSDAIASTDASLEVRLRRART